MKLLYNTLIITYLITFMTSCSVGVNEQIGPQGPQGDKGEPGEEAFVFDYQNISFIAPDYEIVLSYDDDFVTRESDVTLVYFKWDETEEKNEIWRPLPATIFLDDNKILQYNYDWTSNDVKLFLTANFKLDQLGARDTDNWIVRVVVVPGNHWQGRSEVPTYADLEKNFNLIE